jgi:hypothetical protein
MAGERAAPLDRATLQACLDAVDGVAYTAGPDGTILAVGRPGWSGFAAENDPRGAEPGRWIGRPLFSAVSGDAVRTACELMHRRVLEGGRALSYTYRCDAPALERHMRMSAAPLRDGSGAIAAVLYQSVLLNEIPRPAMGLFSRDARTQTVSPSAMLLTLCSYCHGVAWPIGSNGYDADWISPEEYYRRGGGSDVLLSHGMCPHCYETVVEPNL